MRTRLGLVSTLVAALLLIAPSLSAQQVTGRVTNQLSGDPLAAVQVFIAGSGIGALSQQNGRYLLLNVPAGTHTITAERIGYRSVTAQITVTAGQTVVQDFGLTEEALGLDEIIITGTPGGTQRRAIGNSVASVSAAEVQQTVAITTMQEMLSGRTTGLQFSRVGGGVGAGSGITIRGNGSFNLSRDPLIYVDGVRVNNSSESGPNIGDGRQGSVLDDFNPADIESIEIIKGPAAATLYGTEASAGVIQIITKRGSEGAPTFNVGTTLGANFLKGPAYRLGTQYSCRNHEAPPCDPDLASQLGQPDRNDLFTYNMYEEASDQIAQGLFPWPTKHVYQNGLTQSYNVDVRGGTQSIRYFVSANYNDDEGPIWYNTDKAFRGRANIGIVFNENFSLDISSGYVEGKTQFNDPAAGDGGTWTDMAWSSGYKLPSVNPGVEPRRLGFQEHRPDDAAQVEATRDYARFTGSATLNFTSGDWLNSRAILGIDRGWDENGVLFPLSIGDVYADEAKGVVRIERPITTNLSVDWSATGRYAVTDAIGTATSVGVQYYFKKLSEFSSDGEGLPSPLSRTINQIPSSSQTIGFQYVENKSVGLYVQEELSFSDRVFLTAAIRFDDNSAFGSEFELEKYPKLSATWVTSEESFWNVDLINSLRLRGAWGKAGRQPDTFAGTNQYAVIAGPSGTAAFDPASPGNAAVGPETATELELGFDIAVMDDRLSGEFTYFSRQNKDALLSISLPPSVGFGGSLQRNLGQIDTQGWEATVSARVYESDNVSFSLDVSADHTDNEIKELGNFTGTQNIKVGYPWPNLTNRYSIQSASYDPSASGVVTDAWGRKITAMCDSGISQGEGGQYGILPGGPVKNCEEVGRLDLLQGPGYAQYKFSIAPMVSLFNGSVQVRALAEGQHGRWAQERALEWSHWYNNTRMSRCECDPLWVAGDRLRDETARAQYNGAFWKLREVGMRLTLPQAWISQIGADAGSLSLSGQNLGIIWRAQEFIWEGRVSDPEYGESAELGNAGGSFFQTPPMSSVSAALRLSF